MENWIITRDYEILPPDQVRIAGYTVPTQPSIPHVPTSIDVNLPFIIDRLFQGTFALRVVQKTTLRHVAVLCSKTKNRYRTEIRTQTKQIFLFVRNVIDKKLSKKDITAICARYVPLAPCIVFATGIAPQLEQAFYRKGLECKNDVQLMSLKDGTFDKMETRFVPKYIVLNETEIKLVEKTKICSRDQFPRLRATLDAMGRYLWLKPGMVVQTSRTSYRIVVH